MSSMNLGSKEELFLILRKSPKKRWLFMFGLRDRSQKHACKAYVLPLNHIPGPMSFFSCSLGKKKKLLVLLPPPHFLWKFRAVKGISPLENRA